MDKFLNVLLVLIFVSVSLTGKVREPKLKDGGLRTVTLHRNDSVNIGTSHVKKAIEIQKGEKLLDKSKEGINESGRINLLTDRDSYDEIHTNIDTIRTDYNCREYKENKIIEFTVPAEFPGGQAALMKWIKNNLNYPEKERKRGIQGRVIVKFIVEKDGSISNVKIGKGVSKTLDKEAIRLVKRMPKWKPGRNQGGPVKNHFYIPVTFRAETK